MIGGIGSQIRYADACPGSYIDHIIAGTYLATDTEGCISKICLSIDRISIDRCTCMSQDNDVISGSVGPRNIHRGWCQVGCGQSGGIGGRWRAGRSYIGGTTP